MARTPAARLAARTEPDTNGGCLLWTGCTIKDGYGHIRVNGKLVLTHRLAWSVANGPVPAGQQVLHRCDVPACVNPDHLFLGTHADNMADKTTKGRNNLAKLTAADVLAIRARLAVGGESQLAIGRDFGVSQAAVSFVKLGKRWSHLFSKRGDN